MKTIINPELADEITTIIDELGEATLSATHCSRWAVIAIERPNGGSVDNEAYLVSGTEPEIEQVRKSLQDMANHGSHLDPVEHMLFARADSEADARRIAESVGLQVIG